MDLDCLDNLIKGHDVVSLICKPISTVYALVILMYYREQDLISTVLIVIKG